ncbi:hypothetical protein EYF80_015080 [Liparis tanakae]|uniref:Uncharacterized protein n=1 Tax=Liparis tanakae TaxID=230148 RepID=A0A4Z2IBH3_9TELE|nr:hypothetical protein EYF80_015080 [Liparis tanakae]
MSKYDIELKLEYDIGSRIDRLRSTLQILFSCKGNPRFTPASQGQRAFVVPFSLLELDQSTHQDLNHPGFGGFQS